MIDYRGALANERVLAARAGIKLVVGADDRPTTARGVTVHEILHPDKRGPNACPTCDEGVRTNASPVRCRDCILAGL